MYYATFNGGYGLTKTVQSNDQDSLFNIKNLKDWGMGDWMMLGNGGDTLFPDQFLQSQNDRYRLILNAQSGAIQIMDRNNDSKVIWMTDRSSISHPMSAGKFVMQHDGNLAAYNKDGKPYWSTQNWVNPGNYMMLTDSGKMEVKERHYVTRVVFP